MSGPDQSGLSATSRRWLASTVPSERKRLGQYLTPRSVADALAGRVELIAGMKVLDPGVGTGELLAAVARRCPDLDLNGWDVDPSALAAAHELVPGAALELRSTLDPPPVHPAGFDLVIGNPPYFQVRVTPELKSRFRDVISGRANIFALFFKVGLELLKPGGTLAFVVPPSMNSGAYFEALREHIIARAEITDLTLLEGSAVFEGANTAAQLLVLRKAGGAGVRPAPDHRVSTQPFVLERRDDDAGFRRVMFTRNPEELEAGFTGRQTLWQLGYEAVTGTVVWNQRRPDLRAVAGPDTVPLVWSKDLRGGVLNLTEWSASAVETRRGSGGGQEKPGHIRTRNGLTGPALLVNRVVGSVGRGELRSALVPDGIDFVAENHVNVVRQQSAVEPSLGWEDLQRRIAGPGVGDRLRLMTGNTQISATELTHLLPI